MHRYHEKINHNLCKESAGRHFFTNKIVAFQCALNEADEACKRAVTIIEETRDYMVEQAKNLGGIQ